MQYQFIWTISVRMTNFDYAEDIEMLKKKF